MVTTTAMTTGIMTTMAAGGIGMIVGIFLGLALRRLNEGQEGPTVTVV